MKKLVVLAVLLCAVGLFASVSWSDVATSDPSLPAADPGTAPVPPPSPEAHNPFELYSAGPPEATVPYSALTPVEQAVVDRGRDTMASEPVSDAYASASAQQAELGRARAAAMQLGIDDLAQGGVVP